MRGRAPHTHRSPGGTRAPPTTEGAAGQGGPYGLAFVPLAAERFDLVIPAMHAASREVQALIKVLGSRWLLDQLASLPGYDPASCGQHIATFPAN